MIRDKYYPGVKATSEKSIGIIPAGTQATILVSDDKKITIELMVKGGMRKFSLGTSSFTRDFEFINNYFMGYQFSTLRANG